MARQSSSVKSFRYLNRDFFYQIKNIKTLRLKLNEKGEFHLSIPQFYPLEKAKEFLYKNEIWIQKTYLNFQSKKTNLHYSHLSIKKMKTRWGSCNHKKGYINLNLRLLEKNLRAIEYVILHELSHIKFPNHSKEFYDFIHSFMSDFRQREKEF